MSLFKAMTTLVLCVLAFLVGMVVSQMQIQPFNLVVDIERRVLGYDLTPNLNRDTLKKIYASRALSPIVFIGDSHIQFGDWPALLNRTDISSLGIAGENSRELLARIKLRQPEGAKVFISTGTNDVWNLAPEETVANLREIVSRLDVDNEVYLLAPPMTSLPKRNSFIKDIITAENEICTKARCKVVDANSIIAPSDIRSSDTTVDGVHLTDKGYRALAAIIAPFLAHG